MDSSVQMIVPYYKTLPARRRLLPSQQQKEQK